MRKRSQSSYQRFSAPQQDLRDVCEKYVLSSGQKGGAARGCLL